MIAFAHVQNFVSGARVTLGGSVCVGVSVSTDFNTVSCLAPAGYGVVDLVLNVTGYSVSLPFTYDPPVLLAAGPSPINAMLSDANVDVRCCSLDEQLCVA